MIDDRRNGSDHSEPNSGKISKVEDVVELRGRRHHLGLGRVPKHSGDRDQFLCQDAHVFWETATRKKMILI